MKNFKITESAALRLFVNDKEIYQYLKDNGCIVSGEEEKVFQNDPIRLNLYNRLNKLLKYKIPIRYLFDEIESLKYVINEESKIIELFEKYGSEFPGETKESWRERWIDNDDTLAPIKVDGFKFGNNKHLLITILHEAHPYMRVNKIERYVKQKWGLKSYHSDVSRYSNIKHPEFKNIVELLKSE